MNDNEPLRDALRTRADQVGGASPLTLDDVKGRARGIRRRRAAVSGLAAAAVVAVAVPVSIAVTDRAEGPSNDPPVAGPSVKPSETSASTPDSSPVPQGPPKRIALTVEVEETSYAADIPYLYDGAVYLPGGDQVVAYGAYRSIAPVGDGWVGSGSDNQGNAFVDLLDAKGDVIVSTPSTGSLAVSSDGTVVSYATPDGELMTVTPDAERTSLVDPKSLPSGILEPVAVTGSESCDPDAAGGGCAVFFNSADGEERGAWSATSKGVVSPFPDLLALGGVSPDGSVSGLVSVSDTGSCSVVLGPDREKTAWETCDYTLGKFSPDGRYVIGHPAYRDGVGDGSVAILDAATGDLLAEATNSAKHQSFINTVAWDTDSTLVMTVFEADTWSVMRLTPAGELSAIIPKIGDILDEVPVYLSTRP